MVAPGLRSRTKHHWDRRLCHRVAAYIMANNPLPHIQVLTNLSDSMYCQVDNKD